MLLHGCAVRKLKRIFTHEKVLRPHLNGKPEVTGLWCHRKYVRTAFVEKQSGGQLEIEIKGAEQLTLLRPVARCDIRWQFAVLR